jgi:hypothetical protein
MTSAQPIHLQTASYEDNSLKIESMSKIDLISKNIASILTRNLQEVALEPMLEKIFVSRPYFAFEKIYQYEGAIIAPITPQQVIEFEMTPMSSAEAGRHLAILGSCSLAMDETEKKYYLASKALKKTVNINDNTCNKSKKLYAVAIAKSSAKMECFADTALVNEDGEIIFYMDISFQKISAKLFNRVFKEHLRPTNHTPANPYIHTPRLQNLVVNGDTIMAELPIMKDEDCAGHFDGAPMLPVGIMSYIITNHIGEFFKKIDGTKENRYHLLSADLQLFEPTNIKNTEFVEMKYDGKIGKVHKISWIVKDQNGKIRNTMQLSFVHDE